MVLYSNIRVTNDTHSLQLVNESHDASPASEGRDGMTHKISLRPRGTTKLSEVRYIIFADGSEVGTCKVKKIKISSEWSTSVRNITIYSNVVKEEKLSGLRESIFDYFTRKGYYFPKEVYYCHKHGPVVVYFD